MMLNFYKTTSLVVDGLFAGDNLDVIIRPGGVALVLCVVVDSNFTK